MSSNFKACNLHERSSKAFVGARKTPTPLQCGTNAAMLRQIAFYSTAQGAGRLIFHTQSTCYVGERILKMDRQHYSAYTLPHRSHCDCCLYMEGAPESVIEETVLAVLPTVLKERPPQIVTALPLIVTPTNVPHWTSRPISVSAHLMMSKARQRFKKSITRKPS